MVMCLPEEVDALTKPCPRMGAVVVPSASVTKRLFVHGVNLIK